MSELVISPQSVLRGRDLISQYQERFTAITQRWLLVGGQTSIDLVLPRLRAVGVVPVQVVTLRECTETLRQELSEAMRTHRVGGVLACGGGQSPGCGKTRRP